MTIYYRHSQHASQSGFLVVLLLVYGSVFFVVLAAFLGSSMSQWNLMQVKQEGEQALQVAESGLEYYTWYLAHNPGDITHGTGEAGPYEIPHYDPEGGEIGSALLTVEGVEQCGEVGAIDITSTGSMHGSDVTRTVYGRYARPSVAEYSFVINSNVWAGASRDITGPYHSNGYIRMDGTNRSVVTSQQDTWICDDDQLTCAGAVHDGEVVQEGDTVEAIFGSGTGQDLWTSPAPPIDFTNILVDLANFKDKAQNEGGLYIGPSDWYGYRVHFNGDGTVQVREVRRTRSHYEYSSAAAGSYLARNIIQQTGQSITYNIPEECPVLFVEDKVWLSGQIDSKISLAAANPASASDNPSIVLQDNILYTNDGAGFLALAEGDVLLGVDIPNEMEINGIFVAQKGQFGRNYYVSNYLPWGYKNFVFRDSLTTVGTIVSNGRVGTQWVNQADAIVSGFSNRLNRYDRNLVDNPPPLTPRVSDTYQFIRWREIR